MYLFFYILNKAMESLVILHGTKACTGAQELIIRPLAGSQVSNTNVLQISLQNQDDITLNTCIGDDELCSEKPCDMVPKY